MSRRPVWTVVVVLAVTLVAAVLFWPRGGHEGDPMAPVTETPIDEILAVEPVERTLYFPGEGGRLYGETRMLSPEGRLEEQAETLVSSLLSGPQNTSLRAPLPESIRLRRIYRPSETVLILDLESPEGAGPPPVGSQREMLMVYSLVDTLVLNLDPIERVMLLWNGQQRRTLGGHLDTSRPLAAHSDLVAEGRTPPPLPPEPTTAATPDPATAPGESP